MTQPRFDYVTWIWKGIKGFVAGGGLAVFAQIAQQSAQADAVTVTPSQQEWLIAMASGIGLALLKLAMNAFKHRDAGGPGAVLPFALLLSAALAMPACQTRTFIDPNTGQEVTETQIDREAIGIVLPIALQFYADYRQAEKEHDAAEAAAAEIEFQRWLAILEHLTPHAQALLDSALRQTRPDLAAPATDTNGSPPAAP